MKLEFSGSMGRPMILLHGGGPAARSLEVGMRYSDGHEARVGDIVLIDGKHRGTVVASIDADEYSTETPKEQWAHLGKGVLIHTDFGGLVHYPDLDHEHIVLSQRKP